MIVSHASSHIISYVSVEHLKADFPLFFAVLIEWPERGNKCMPLFSE